MRTNKLLAALAATTVIAGAALAQAFGPSQLSFGDNVVSTVGGQTPMVITVTPNSDFWASAPGANRYAFFVLRFMYDPSKIDLSIGGTLASTLADGTVFSPLGLVIEPGVNGLAVGQKLSYSGKVVIELGIGNASNNNTRLTGNFFGTEDPDGNFVPLQWVIYTTTPYTIEMVPPGQFSGDNGQIAKVSPARTSRFNLISGTFVVPEPASMIALGSGLVGLLALRRRRKA